MKSFINKVYSWFKSFSGAVYQEKETPPLSSADEWWLGLDEDECMQTVREFIKTRNENDLMSMIQWVQRYPEPIKQRQWGRAVMNEFIYGLALDIRSEQEQWKRLWESVWNDENQMELYLDLWNSLKSDLTNNKNRSWLEEIAQRYEEHLQLKQSIQNQKVSESSQRKDTSVILETVKTFTGPAHSKRL